MTMLLLTNPAQAAPSNETLSFSARLKSSTGAIVADGYYNIRFKLYSQASGGSAVWTETYHDANGASEGQDYRIKVANGYFSVKLGSLEQFTGVDWSGDLFLTMDVGGTALIADWDGEMDPRIQLSAVPYALNAQRLGGKTADQFLQVGSGVQDLGNETSIAINKTGSGDLMQFKSSGTDVFTLSGSGSITLGAAADQSISVADSSATAGHNLTLAAGSATSGDNAGGNLVLQAGNGSGTGSDGVITMASDVTVGAGNTITMVGGATSMRPASPSEGTIFYDTDTKQLLVYADSKWQPLNGGGTSTATKVVAASDSPQAIKNTADFVADGTADQVEINAAISGLSSSGGSVYLAEGTYNIAAPVVIDKVGTTLSGSGSGTVLLRQYDGLDSTDGVVTLMANDLIVEKLKIDGNKSLYTSGNNNGIISSSMRSNITISGTTVTNGGGTGILTQWNVLGGNGYGKRWNINDNIITANNNSGIAITRAQSSITNNYVSNNTQDGITTTLCEALPETSLISHNHVLSNGNTGITTTCVSTVVTNNITASNLYGIWVSSQYATVSSNSIRTNQTGIRVGGVGDVNIMNNNFADNTGLVIYIQAPKVRIESNTISIPSGASGFTMNNERDDIVVSDNTVHNYSINNVVPIKGDNSVVTSNRFVSLTGSGNAIALTSTANNTHISDNVLTGYSTTGIEDLGTGTTYSNQLDASGNLVNRSSGGFDVQTSAGSDAMTIDATTGDVAVAGTLEAGSIETASVDTSSAGSLALAANNATSVTIGSSDTAATLLVLDTKTDTGDPTGVNGAMYYNADAGKFRCYQAGSWVDCVTPLPVSKVVDSTVNISDTPGDVTGLSFSLAANTKYYYKFVIMNDSDTSNNGIGFGITAPGDVVTSNWCANTNTSKDSNESDQPGIGTYCGTDDVYTLVEGVDTPSNSRVTNIEGYLETGVSTGNLQLRAQADFSSGQTIREGSFGILQIVQ